MPVILDKAGVGEDDHVVFELVDEVLEGGAVVDIGRVTVPIDDLAQVIEHKAELAAYNPALVGLARFANLRGAASFAARMQQLDAVGVHHAYQRGRSQKVFGIGLVERHVEQTEQPGPLG